MVIHKKKYLAIFLAAIISPIIGVVGSATAQETSNEKEVKALRGNNFTLEEIIVTARRRDETLSTTPIAIDVLSAVTLREKGVNTLEEVAKLSPGLSFEVGVLPNDTRPVIRGLSINRGRPNVGILVDGIDVSSETLTVSGGGTSANLELMDLERVEVVKGPQSALYGRSAFGGAVNYITSRPDGESGGRIGVDFDEHGYQKYNISGNAGLSENLAASLHLTTSDFDGYYTNPNTGGDLGGIETDGVAIAFNYTPSDTFSAYLRGEFSEEHYTPRAVALKKSLSHISSPFDFFLSGSVGADSALVPIPGGAFGGRIPETSAAACATATPFAYTVGGRTACATMLMGDQGRGVDESLIDQSPNPDTGKDFNGTEIENSRISLELAWEVGGVNVVSLTGVSSNETTVSEDFDLTNFDLSSFGPGSANFDPQYVFANPFGAPPTFVPDFTPLGNNPAAAFTQIGANTNSDTSFDSNQFSQEIRISGESERINWLVSLQYWKEDMDAVMNQMWWVRESADIDYWNSTFSRFADPTCAVPGNVNTCFLFRGAATGPQPLEIPMSRDTEHVSIAASLTFDIADNQRLTVEGRYLEEDIEYRSLPLDTFINGFLNLPYFDPATFSFVPVEQQKKIEDDAFVPRVSYDWQATDNTFVYASYAEGFKPGGIATTDGNGDISTGEYKPEELQAYEIGMKTALLDNRLRVEGAVFYNDYTDQQVPFFVANSVGVTNVSVTNAGASEVQGFELSTAYRPSENWTFTAAYTYADTEYKEFNISKLGNPGTYDRVQSGNADGNFAGKSFTNSAKNAVNVAIRFDKSLDSGINYFTELAARYQSKRYLDQGNLSYLPEYWLVDFTGGIDYKNWNVVLYVENLADDDKVKSGLGNVSYGFLAGGQVPAFAANLSLPQPRTVGLRASYSF